MTMMKSVRFGVVSLLLVVGVAGCSRDAAPGGESSMQPTKKKVTDSTIAVQPVVTVMGEVPVWAGAATVEPSLACYGDTLNNQGGLPAGSVHQITSGKTFTFSGWAVDKSLPAGTSQAPALFVLTPQNGDGKAQYFQANRNERSDVTVASEFAAIKPTMAGVTINAGTSGVPVGTYQVEFVVGNASVAKKCSLGPAWIIEITPS